MHACIRYANSRVWQVLPSFLGSLCQLTHLWLSHNQLEKLPHDEVVKLLGTSVFLWSTMKELREDGTHKKTALPIVMQHGVYPYLTTRYVIPSLCLVLQNSIRTQGRACCLRSSFIFTKS